jgi:predicted nucleic acid-binding protein
MGAYYFDSSALVKRYADETGTRWVRSLTEPQAGHDIFTAHITSIEVVAAIARKTRIGEIAEHDATTAISTFKSHFKTQYRIVVMTTGIVDRAMELAEQHRLRGYDAADETLPTLLEKADNYAPLRLRRNLYHKASFEYFDHTASATTAIRLPRRAAMRSAQCRSLLPTIPWRRNIRQAAPTNNARICPLPCLVILPRCCCSPELHSLGTRPR